MVATLSSQGQLLLNLYLVASVIVTGLILAQSWLRGATRQAEIDALSERITTLESHLTQAIATVEAQRLEIQDLKSQLETAHADHQALTQRYQTLQADHENLTAQLTTLTESRDVLVKELAAKKGEIEDSWFHTMATAPQAFIESLPFMPKFDPEHK